VQEAMVTKEMNIKTDSILNYEHPYVCTDAAVFTISTQEPDSYRKLAQPSLQVLLYQRETEPFKGKYCLPGGFLSVDELPQDNIIRKLSEKSKVEGCFLEQLFTFCDLDRDPRARVISIAYLGLMNETSAQKLGEETLWFTLQASPGRELVLQRGRQKLTKQDFGFDHYRILKTAYERLQAKILYSNIAVNLLPEEFTLTQLQNLYETIQGKKEQAANFRRKVMDMLQETERFTSDKGHRPARLYRKKSTTTKQADSR